MTSIYEELYFSKINKPLLYRINLYCILSESICLLNRQKIHEYRNGNDMIYSFNF